MDLSLGMNACNCVGAKHVYCLENYNCCQTIFVFSLNIAHCICGWQANDLEDNESFFCERARLYVTTDFCAKLMHCGLQHHLDSIIFENTISGPISIGIENAMEIFTRGRIYDLV